MNRRDLLACVATLLPLAARAQGYPVRALRMVVPFAPGGPADVLGRAVGQALAETLGQPVVVENKTGAAGNIGVDAIAKAAPDGHVMGVVPTGNIAVNPSLFANLPYKASELAPVALLATVENVLVVNAEVPARSLKELLALAAAKPGTLSFASPGAGSQAHLAGELMQLAGGVKLVHVPYKGTGPALNDLLGGQLTMMFSQVSSALPHVKSGKLRAIGLASLSRSALLPDVPTLDEQGLARFEALSWYALMVPAATPGDVVARLAAEAQRALARPDVRDKLAALGLQVGSDTPAQLSARIQTETQRWADVIRRQNIKPD
jgi:tripartite-type tricarboxylate transporter receptor subunit TctC